MTDDARSSTCCQEWRSVVERALSRTRRCATRLANLLGNLTLLTYDQNAATTNRIRRSGVYFDTNAPIHALTKDIAPIEDWTLQAIEERHERLVRILSEDWGHGSGRLTLANQSGPIS
jgi:hypothetical protein